MTKRILACLACLARWDRKLLGPTPRDYYTERASIR